MRALAHPARLAILEEMINGRAGTATEFAEVCGLTPSATSYHLRALARAGLVEEAPGRGDGRERLWQRPAASVGGFELDPNIYGDDEAKLAARDMIAVVLSREDARVRTFLATWAEESREWFDAIALGHGILMVTPEELSGLNDQILAMVQPYTRTRRTDPPPGARPVSVTYRAFPLPEQRHGAGRDPDDVGTAQAETPE
jgi:DNA-binding transcriptional ArsR family regulator